jgi:multidrug efflux pump subunit AcrA (membrane-fusion protein)
MAPPSTTDQEVFSALSDARTKEINAARARRLSPSVVSEADRDTAAGDERVAQANLRRARSLRDYEVVRAPFAGVVTARYVDDGALLPAATGSTQSALPLVDFAHDDRVRVFVYVGQDLAPFVRAGDAAWCGKRRPPTGKFTPRSRAWRRRSIRARAR